MTVEPDSIPKTSQRHRLECELKFKQTTSDILITGAAGSIGSALVKELAGRFPEIYIRAFDNNEYGLFRLKLDCPQETVIPILGDVKDAAQLDLAIDGADTVIHLAAIKRIEISAFNPIEAIKTNVLGTMNLIHSCHRHMAKRVLLVSSDKAVPCENQMSLYGSTKFQQERLFMWAHKMFLGGEPLNTKYSIARFGNVVETRGNVFEQWKLQKEAGEPITITDPSCERFFLWMDGVIIFLLRCLYEMDSGEIFIPLQTKLRNIMDFVDENEKIRFIGLREGEVLKHRIVTPLEEQQSVELDWCIKVVGGLL